VAKSDGLTDKNGILLDEFDILKVFHFTGARKKKYYMYKMVVRWQGELYGAHLDKTELTPSFPLWTSHGKETLSNSEIVESKNWKKLG
jgi:hypothetical protein